MSHYVTHALAACSLQQQHNDDGNMRFYTTLRNINENAYITITTKNILVKFFEKHFGPTLQ